MHTCPYLAKECILPPLLAVPYKSLKTSFRCLSPVLASKFLAWRKKNNIRGKWSSSWSFCNFHLLPSCLGQYVMICATSLQRERSKLSASVTGRWAWTKQWSTALVHCVKHEKIFEQVAIQTDDGCSSWWQDPCCCLWHGAGHYQPLRNWNWSRHLQLLWVLAICHHLFQLT